MMHVISGILFLSMAFMHIYRNWGKLKPRIVSWQIVDRILLVNLFLLLVSGILLYPFRGTLIPLMLHKISSVFLVLGMIVHVVQHYSLRIL